MQNLQISEGFLKCMNVRTSSSFNLRGESKFGCTLQKRPLDVFFRPHHPPPPPSENVQQKFDFPWRNRWPEKGQNPALSVSVCPSVNHQGQKFSFIPSLLFCIFAASLPVSSVESQICILCILCFETLEYSLEVKISDVFPLNLISYVSKFLNFKSSIATSFWRV